MMRRDRRHCLLCKQGRPETMDYSHKICLCPSKRGVEGAAPYHCFVHFYLNATVHFV